MPSDSKPVFSYAETYSGNQAILKCVERGLDILGESARISTIYFIERKSGIKFTEIQNKPDEFVDSLRRIFGLGSGELLRSILTQLRLEEKSRRDGVLRHFADSIERGLDSVESGIQ